MRELDCDFCGGGATGAYEVVPAELDPTSDEQVRVVLCENCRETLDGVLSPLFDRLGVGTPVEPSFASNAAGHGVPPASDDGADEHESTAEHADPTLTADAAGHERPDASAPDATQESTDDAEATASNDEDAVADEQQAAQASSTTAREEPQHFRKVMRFLNNREFPVDRAEVAEFAAGAYDLEDDEVDEIFDYAVERGILADEDGQLVKG